MSHRFEAVDSNQDGFVDVDELPQFFKASQLGLSSFVCLFNKLFFSRMTLVGTWTLTPPSSTSSCSISGRKYFLHFYVHKKKREKKCFFFQGFRREDGLEGVYVRPRLRETGHARCQPRTGGGGINLKSYEYIDHIRLEKIYHKLEKRG